MKLELIHRVQQGHRKPTPLLFVHGKWHAAWCWDEHFLPYFAEHGYESVAFSLRGHAGSEGREGLRWYSIAEYVEDVEQVAGRFDAPPVLIGHSMGGFITQKFLETHPKTPAAVLLASIPPSGVWPTTFSFMYHKPLTMLKVLGRLSLYAVIETPALAQWSLFSASMPNALVEKYHQRLQEESFRTYLDELGLNLVRSGRIKTPLLVIGAENDTVITLKMVKSTARTYKTQAEIFPNIAHDMMLEAGWEKVAKRILDWLDEKGL